MNLTKEEMDTVDIVLQETIYRSDAMDDVQAKKMGDAMRDMQAKHTIEMVKNMVANAVEEERHACAEIAYQEMRDADASTSRSVQEAWTAERIGDKIMERVK